MEMSQVHQFVSRGFKYWVALTLAFVIGNLSAVLLGGRRVFSQLIQQGPASYTGLTLACVAMAWLSLGLLLMFLNSPRFGRRYWLVAICAFVAVLLYTNLCRERIQYGDSNDFVLAAMNLGHGEHLHGRYLYPPLLANTMELFVPLGQRGMQGLLWACNIISVGVFVVVMTATLQRYGISARAAPLLTLLFVLLNVPLLRTIFYVQVNLPVINFILLALLSYLRFPLVSALCLAVAIHMKASPAVLVLPFLLERDRRWMLWEVVSLVALASITLAAHGVQPFQDFFHNARNIYAANGIWFRENSVDSLVRATGTVLGISLDSLRPVTAVAKAAVLLPLLLLAFVCIRRRTFSCAQGRGSAVLNAMPVLLLFMLLASPLVWEHHPIFVALPFLLMIRQMDTPGEWLAYGFAYFLEYLVPTFDFYPWSYGRLLSPLILAWLVLRTSDRSEGGKVFRRMQGCLDSLHWGRADRSADNPPLATGSSASSATRAALKS